MAEKRSRYKGVFPYALDMLEGSGVAVHVGCGDAQRVWHLPEKLLKSNSKFFTAALEGGFAEGISKSITLPEENPGIFKYFVEWLFVGENHTVAEDPKYLVCLWTLGDRLACPLMQDDAMCSLICYYDYWRYEEVPLKQIYEGSAPGSKIRRFAVDQCLLDVRMRPPPRNGIGWSYSRFVKDNEDFAQQFTEATILLGTGNPNNPYDDKSRYLFAPSTAKSI